MLRKFNQNLLDDLKKYFQQYHSLTISDEQADKYLDSITDMFITFNAMREDDPHP